MTTVYFPIILPDEYGNYLGLAGSDLPGEYKDWQRYIVDRARDVRSQGGDVRLINVHFSDFKEHLEKLHIPVGGRAELFHYAETQGMRPSIF